MDFRVGNGYDVHRLAEGLDLWICGIKIEHSKGCVAHSDGDTPIHALCDAMLGALALGDIGKHFPDTSDDFKGIDSTILLSSVNKLIKSHGYTINNADITIALQRPKIGPYITQMRQRLAEVLQTDIDRISIKATTTEKLGFVGREEGIEAYATVLLVKE
ncbi:MAG: 2-C-methyl-D-erythritol 2,4-cyclodiphosphate synthase [Bacteroidales bacterium]